MTFSVILPTVEGKKGSFSQYFCLPICCPPCLVLDFRFGTQPTLYFCTSTHSKVKQVNPKSISRFQTSFFLVCKLFTTPVSHNCIYSSEALTSHEKWLLAYELALNASSQLFVICVVQLVCLITRFCLLVPSTDGWTHLNQENNWVEK